MTTRRYVAGVCAILIAVAALCGAASGGAAPQDNGRIVFAGSPPAALYVVGPANAEPRLLTARSAGIRAPVWSPDRRSLAFLSGDDLYVLGTGGRPARRLTRGGGVLNQPTWSPDGRLLAYIRWRGGSDSLVVARADGGGRQVLASRLGSTFGSAAWSPDGGRIAFARETTGGQRLVLLRLRDGVETRLTSTATDSDGDPDWSPDGRTIVFTRIGENADDRSVHAVDVRSRAVRRVAKYGEAPAWAPNGKAIAYYLETGLYVASTSGSRRRLLNDVDCDVIPCPDAKPQWSPDSRELVVAVDRDVIAVRANGLGRRKLADLPPELLLRSAPVWAPNGRQVAYAARPFTRDLYTIAPDGSRLRRLTRDLRDEADPAWSPDGRLIACTRGTGDAAEVAVMPRDGGETRIVAKGADPDWSPDGRELVFAQGGDLHVLTLADGSIRRLDTGAGLTSLFGPAWSPDGRRLAFGRTSYMADTGDEVQELYVAGADGTIARRVAVFDCLRDPAWSPDSRRIAFSAILDCLNEPPVASILTTDAAATGPSRTLVGIPQPSGHTGAAWQPAWSPDGRMIAYVRTVSTVIDESGELSDALVVAAADGRRPRSIYRGVNNLTFGISSVTSPDWGP